jgi:hypothetical protein
MPVLLEGYQGSKRFWVAGTHSISETTIRPTTQDGTRAPGVEPPRSHLGAAEGLVARLCSCFNVIFIAGLPDETKMAAMKMVATKWATVEISGVRDNSCTRSCTCQMRHLRRPFAGRMDCGASRQMRRCFHDRKPGSPIHRRWPTAEIARQSMCLRRHERGMFVLLWYRHNFTGGPGCAVCRQSTAHNKTGDRRRARCTGEIQFCGATKIEWHFFRRTN